MDNTNVMTREDILKMEAGREMNALVAERVMGWHFDIDPKYPEKKVWLDKNNNYICNNSMWDYQFSTNIADAWRVVEKLNSMDIDIILNIYVGGGYSCYLGKEIPNMAGSMEIADNNHATSMPLAICRAALLACSTGYYGRGHGG
jgi:hypothetical protein